MDSGSFKKIFDKYYDNIRNFLYYRSGNIETAEDLVQDVFLRLWENREKIREESVGGYLYTIAANLIKNHYRRNEISYQFINSLTQKNNSESPEFLMEMQEFDHRLQQTLAAMPEKSRDVFLMNRIDGLTYGEIADRLQLSIKAVEKRMHKALSFLKEHLDIKI
jgi:RNA polymerase sigma-70 factor (ECF subfamily)